VNRSSFESTYDLSDFHLGKRALSPIAIDFFIAPYKTHATARPRNRPLPNRPRKKRKKEIISRLT
jgi:hypothetical protein